MQVHINRNPLFMTHQRFMLTKVVTIFIMVNTKISEAKTIRGDQKQKQVKGNSEERSPSASQLSGIWSCSWPLQANGPSGPQFQGLGTTEF